MTLKQAREHRSAMERASASLDDKTASTAPGIFPRLKGDGSLVTAGTRIDWGGVLKRAAADLWDNEQNTPEAAPNLWEDIPYREGVRIIPEVITVGLAFFKGEKGWWKDERYRSCVDDNVWTPEQNSEVWVKE